ncbi:zinc ribbon domain-containing protein [Chloroflexota bacterium]
MRKKYRILLSFLAISLLFIFIDKSPVLAQEEKEVTGFDNVQLWIYPEYDDPRLLVMLEGQIAGAEPPAVVKFLVPSKAEMYSAGSMDAQGQYSGGPPHREPSSISDWDEITYEVTTNTFRVEYYDPIIIGQSDKSIYYEFRWLHPISKLKVIVQEPRRSSSFNVSPAGNALVDNQGFTSYLYNFSELEDMPPLRFEINYHKSDTRPSQSINGNESSDSFLMVVIVVILGAAAVVGFFWIRKSRPRTREARRQLARNSPERKPKNNQSRTRFCSQCGQPIDISDKFCTHCGAKLT